MERTDAVANFEDAARYDRELTDRQREVLRLIAAGKTNAEIGDALGMTLAGAKWHVSELLSKLALESREEAAKYYRWRKAPQRRMSRAMRGLVSAGMSRLGLGVGGGLAAAAVGVAVLAAMGADEPDPGPAVPGLPFYMEATFTRSEADYSYDAARRYWYEDTTRQRVELDSPVLTRVNPASGISFGPAGTSVTVRDGQQEWRDLGRYHQGTDLSRYAGGQQTLIGTALGPIPERTIGEFIERLQGRSADPTTKAQIRLTGTERMLGREVDKIEVLIHDDAGNSIASRLYWLDAERLLVLRHDTHSALEGGGSLDQSEAATKIAYDAKHPPGQFGFVSSANSVEITCANTGPDFLRLGVVPKPFFNVPRDALPGLTAVGFGTQVADDGSCSVGYVDFVPGPGMEAVVSVRQEAINVDSVFGAAPSEPVDLGSDIEARLGDADDAGRSVAWVARGVGIEVRSMSMSDEALLEFARLMVAANP